MAGTYSKPGHDFIWDESVGKTLKSQMTMVNSGAKSVVVNLRGGAEFVTYPILRSVPPLTGL